MIQAGRGNSNFFLSVKNLGDTIQGGLKDAIISNGKNALRMMPPQDSIQLAIEVQRKHAVSNDTQGILDEKAAVESELAQYRANHEANKGLSDSQSKLIQAQATEIADLKTQVNTPT